MINITLNLTGKGRDLNSFEKAVVDLRRHQFLETVSNRLKPIEHELEENNVTLELHADSPEDLTNTTFVARNCPDALRVKIGELIGANEEQH